MAFGTLVDSNVLIDLLQPESPWSQWSTDQFVTAAYRGPVVINPLIFGELSTTFDTAEALDRALPGQVEREDLPWDAAFLAGRIFVRYRHAGGTRRSPLPDFYIAAHAAVTGRALLTRDRPRHLDLLPRLEVIAPARP